MGNPNGGSYGLRERIPVCLSVCASCGRTNTSPSLFLERPIDGYHTWFHALSPPSALNATKGNLVWKPDPTIFFLCPLLLGSRCPCLFLLTLAISHLPPSPLIVLLLLLLIVVLLLLLLVLPSHTFSLLAHILGYKLGAGPSHLHPLFTPKQRHTYVACPPTYRLSSLRQAPENVGLLRRT